MDRFGLSAQFDFNSGNSANQISGISSSIAGLIDTIQDLEKAVGSSDNFGKKIAKQLDFAPKKGQMRGVAKDVEAISTAATNAKKNLMPLKDEFRAIRAESRNIDLGDLGDDKQYKKGRAELVAYTKSLKMLQAQTKGNSTAEREFNASLVAGEKAAKNKLEIMESQRKALSAAQKVGVSTAAVVIGKAAIDPVKQFATDSMKILSEFDDKMAAVAAVVQPTTDQLKALRKQAAALGASTRYDAAQAAEAMGELGSAGFTTQQIMIGIGDTLSLASAGSLGLAEAAEISASSLNGFGMEVNQLGHVVDVFAIAAAKTNAGIKDIGETMKYAAPQAALFGSTIEETTALIGTMANAGIKGSSSGTALRSIFTRLAAPTGPAQGALDSMGVKIKDAKGKLRNIMEIMDDLQVKMGLNSEDLSQQKAFFARVAASGENVDVAIAKLKKSGDKQADNIDTIKTLVGAEAMSAFGVALQNNAKTKQAVYAEMAGSYDQAAFNQVLMQTTAENKNFDELRAAFADKSASGQEKFKKIDIFKYVSEATASYTQAAGLINQATDGLAIQGASTVIGDDLALVQKTLTSFKDTDEKFASQFKDVDFSSYSDGVDLLQALVKGTGDTKKGALQFQAALKASNIGVEAFTGAGKNMANVMEDSLTGDIRNMESAMDSLRLNSIEPFKPLIRGVINAISGFANFLANMPEPVRVAIGALQMLAFALGAVLVAGGSIGIILFGFEQAAATAAIATTVLEGSTIALTGFFGTSLTAAAGVNPLTASLGGLRTTASTLFGPLTALKTLVFELGRAMMAQMMSPLGLILIGLTALYLIFEALTPQFDVLGRLMGVLAAPFGLLYGFAKGIGKALMTLIAPLVKIGTVAAGFPFVSVSKSLAMAVDYFGQFAAKGEAAGVAFVDYFAAPIVMAAEWIASAWNGAIGNIQGYMDGLVGYALNIAQLLIGALNHNPTIVIPNSWDGAVARIKGGLQSLVAFGESVAAALIGAFNFAFEKITSVGDLGSWAGGKITEMLHQLSGYLNMQFDFDIAGALIAQMKAGEGDLGDYFAYIGKTFIPGLINTWMFAPLSGYQAKFSGIAAALTGLKADDIFDVEHLKFDKIIVTFDRIKANAEDLFATFRSGGDLISAAFSVFNDPNNTTNLFSKTIDLISNSFAGMKIQLDAAGRLLALFLGGALISILPTTGAAITTLSLAIQFFFKTIGGFAVVTIALFRALGNTIVSFVGGVGSALSAFDPNAFFSGMAGSLDRVTTALKENLNIFTLFALIGSTLPLGFVFSKGVITKELSDAIPAFYKAIALILPAGMGTLIANGLSADLLAGMVKALGGIGGDIINIIGTTLDWYGIMERSDFDKIIDGMGQQFNAIKTQVESFIASLYAIPEVKAVVDATFGGINSAIHESVSAFAEVNSAIRFVFGLLKTGFDVGDFHVSLIDIFGLDIAIKAALGFFKLFQLDQTGAFFQALGTSFKGVGELVWNLGDGFRLLGVVFQGLIDATLPPFLAFLVVIRTAAIDTFNIIKAGAIDLAKVVLAALRAINPEIYDYLAGNVKAVSDTVVVEATKAGAKAVEVSEQAQVAAKAIDTAVRSSEAVQGLSRTVKFLKFLSTTAAAPLVPYLEKALALIQTLGKAYFSFPFMGINSVLNFIKALPFTELTSFFLAMTKAAYNSNAIFMWLGSSLKNLLGDGGKVLKFLGNFSDIYMKTKGFSDLGGGKGIKVFTPLDMLFASSRKFNSELNKVSVTKLFQISGSLERGVGSSLELGNILKNFGVIQRAALLPGVVSYIAAWAGAGLVIYPVLKGIIHAAAIGLFSLPWGDIARTIGQSISDGIRGAFVDHNPFAMLVVGFAAAMIVIAGLWASGMSVVTATIATGAGGAVAAIIGLPIAAAMGSVAAMFNGGLTGVNANLAGFNEKLAAKNARMKAHNEEEAIRYRLRADKLSATLGRKVLATEIDRLSIYDRIKEMVADTGDFFKSIPEKITQIFGSLMNGLLEIGSSVLALIFTFGILAKYMGKDIRLIIGTAFGSVGDGVESAKRRAGRFNPIEKIRLSKSDRQVDKDRVAINKEAFDLKVSNSGIGRSLAALANKTGKTKIEIIPEYERADRAEKMPRRAELNLLDREVLKAAEANLRQSKTLGANGKSGRFAKFSTEQLETESAAVFRNEKQIREVAFNVANSGEAGYQTDKNIATAALEQLKADPTAMTGKGGKYTKNQIQDQESKIRADKTQMAKLSVGKAFSDLASNMTLAGAEALKGLGQETERQKFIDGGELIDEDLTIKAKTVQLFVNSLGIDGADLVKKGQMTDAAMIVASRQVAGGDNLRDLKLDRSAVEAVYKSFSRTEIRKDVPNPNGENFLRFGSGGSIPASLISQNNDRRRNQQDPDLSSLDQGSSLFNNLPNNREGMRSFVSTNITRSQTENLNSDQSAHIEAQMVLQLKELSLVFESIAGNLTYRENPETGRYEVDPTISEALEMMGRVATGDGAIKTAGAANYLNGKSDDDNFAKDLGSRMPALIESIYGKDSNLRLREYSRTTGAFDPTGGTPSNFSNLGNLELLKQVMVDLIGQLNTRNPGSEDPLLGGQQMAMVAKLFAGNKPELPVKTPGALARVGSYITSGEEELDPDEVLKLLASKPKERDFSTAFQKYGMSAQGVSAGDVNYDAINTNYETQRQRILATMDKDFDFFEAANKRFGLTIAQMDEFSGGKGIKALDLLTSPDLVSDLNFSKLIAGQETDLAPEIDRLLQQVFTGMKNEPETITPAMRKSGKLQDWKKADARRAVAAAQMVGMDVDAEVLAGLSPTDLAIKATAVRQEMGIALKSFMALAIPSDKEIKAAMTLTYKKMGVGNTINWDEILPQPKGTKPVDNAARYKAIAASFNRSPVEMAQKQSEANFMDQFQKTMAQDKQRTGADRQTAATFMKNVAQTALLGGVYSKDKFDSVVQELGLTEEIKNSAIIKSSQAAIAAASPENKAKVEADAKMNALGQAYLKRTLKQNGLGKLGNALVDNTPENQERGFNDFTSAISGDNPNLPTGKQDFGAAMGKIQGSAQKGGIEGVLNGLIEPGSDPREHAEKIRTAAILIANGQLDLLAPDILLAVAKHTKNSVATLIRPELNDETGAPVDRIKVNTLRRLEVQRRLKQNGIAPSLFADRLGEQSDNLYKGRFSGMRSDDQAQFTNIAEALNTNNKLGKEAEVELIASLSQQALLAKHQDELNKRKLSFFKNDKRSSAIQSLYAEAAQRSRDNMAAGANKRAAGQKRYQKMMALIVAQDPARFEELSAYGSPRSGIGEKQEANPLVHSTDPAVNKIIGDYNLTDIFQQLVGQNAFLNEGAVKTLVQMLVNGKKGTAPSEFSAQLATSLPALINKLGIDAEQFVNLQDLDLETILSPADLEQVNKILAQMSKYEVKRRGGDIEATTGVANRSKQTVVRLETLLMQMAPTETVKVSDKDPKQTRSANIDELLRGAGVDVVNEQNKPKLADNFYQKVLSGASMPLDGPIAAVEAARSKIQSSLSRIELEQPEIARFMSELGAVQSELEVASANKTSPVAALAKLMRLEGRLDSADEATSGLGRLHEVAPDLMTTKSLFGKKSLPAEILPEIFGSVRDDSEAQAKMMKGISKEGSSFDGSNEYQLAGLAASLGELTDGYQVHSKKLIELRAKFGAGSNGFYELIKETTNANLLKSADDNKLYEAMIALYEGAAGKGIDLSAAGMMQYQLKNAKPEELGIDQNQLDLLREFGTDNPSNLTLDPTVRSATNSLDRGQMLDRDQLHQLKVRTASSDLEFFAAGQGNLTPLSGEQQSRADAMKEAVNSSLGGDFNSGMKEDRQLVDTLMANGVDKATALGDAIAQEYSILYAYVNKDTNKIDANSLTGLSTEGVNLIDKIASDIDPAQANSIKAEGLKALMDIVEGRRTTIEKFNDGERLFLTAFQTEIGFSQKQLFDLQNAIPKTRAGKILAILPQSMMFFAKRYQKIAEQKTYSLNRFIQRSGLDYEQLIEVLKEEGFDSLQIQKILQNHGSARNLRQNTKNEAQVNLIKMLAKYSGMSKKSAKESIVAQISQLKGVDKDADARQLELFIETEIKKQKYTKEIETKILNRISGTNRIGTDLSRYAEVTDPGLLLSERIGADTAQMKKLAGLMGVDREKLDQLFTDKGGILGELAYAGDYLQIAKEALDPLNLAKQLARIFSGDKVGNYFAKQVDQITAKRTAKLYAVKKSFSLTKTLMAPVIGSALQTFKVPAEAVLDWMINFNANNSDWFNKNLAGRIPGGEGASKLAAGIESDLRDIKFQAQKVDEMPSLKKVRTALWEKTGVPGLGRFINRLAGIPDPDIVQGEIVDPQIPQMPDQGTLPGGSTSTGSIGGADFTAAAPPMGIKARAVAKIASIQARAVAKIASIQSGIQRSFTADGAEDNIAKIVAGSVSNPLNQALKGMVEGIGMMMKSSAEAAIEATGATQVVTDRDEAGLRTTIAEQRNPLRTLQKRVGQTLIDYASPMGNIYRFLGEGILQIGSAGVDAIELLEQGISKSNSSDLSTKLAAAGAKARDFLVNMGQTIDTALTSGDAGTNPIAPALNALKQTIQSTVGNIFSSIGNAFEQLTGVTKNSLRDAIGSIFGAIKGIFGRLKNIGRKIVANRVEAQQVTPPAAQQANPVTAVEQGATADGITGSPAGGIVDILGSRRQARREARKSARNAVQLQQDLTADQLLAANGFDPQTGTVAGTTRNDFTMTGQAYTPPIDPTVSALDLPNDTASVNVPVVDSNNPAPPRRSFFPAGNPSANRMNRTRELVIPNPALEAPGGMVPTSNPSPDIIDAEIVTPAVPQNKYDILDEDINRKIEENWDGTSDSIIKNIKNLALVSKKLGYWIMRNLSEGSPGPTYYMRQHYADTTDFIEADLKRLVTAAQRSGKSIQAGLMGNAIDLDLTDLPKVANMVISTTAANPTIDDEFTGAISQAEQFQSANIAAANLAANSAVVNDHTQNTATAMADVAKAEVKVDQKGKKLFKFFNVMWKAMKIVPKGFVKMGQVFKKIGKPVMMMGAGFSAAGFAIQNISSNLSTLGIVNEQQSEMIQKGSAVMEIFGGIGAIGGAALQVLLGGFTLLMESSVGLIAFALNPMSWAILGIGAAVIAGIFALNWLSKTFLGFDFIAPVFDGIGGSMSSLWSFIMEKIAPAIAFLRSQFAQAFGYDALTKLDGAIAWLGNAWNIGFKAIASGLSWLQGVMSAAAEHMSGIVGVLAILFAPLIAIGWLTFKLFEALFNAIAPGLTKLMPVLDELAVKFQAAFGPTIDWIVGAWTGGLDKIGDMMVGLWQMAEKVGNWLIGALNCNPTVQIPLAWQSATDNIMGMMNYLPDHAKATADKMVGFFGSAFDWLGGKQPDDINSKVGITKTTTESTVIDPATGVAVPITPSATATEPVVPVVAAPAMPELPDWMQGIGSFVAEKMGTSATVPNLPLPVDPTGSLANPKAMVQALTVRAEGIDSRKGMALHAGAEHKATAMRETASGITDLVSQSEYLGAEYEDLVNPQGFKKMLAILDQMTGSTQKRTKEIITQRGEIEKTLKTVVDGAKEEIKVPIGADLLMKLGIDPDALDTAGTEIQSGLGALSEQMITGFQDAVAPMATYWDDAMTSVAEVGVGGTANAIFGHALWNITEGVGTVGMAFKDLSGEVFESLKTMDFKRMANAGKMFTSTMGEGLGQIVRGFQDAANGAAFFAAFSVTSGFLPMLIFGGLVALLIFLTLKFGNLREITTGAFQIMGGAARVFWVALSSIKPIVERLGDVFKGVFAAMKGDFEPLKTAITNLKLEFEIMFAKMGPGFAQITDGLKLIAKGFQPVIDEGILPMIEGVKDAFGRLVDFFLDPFRNAIKEFKQFGADLQGLAMQIVTNVQAEFADIFTTVTGAAKFAISSVQGFFDDFGQGVQNVIGIVSTTISDLGKIFTTGIADITTAFKAAWEGIGIGATGIEGIGKGIQLVAGEVTTLGGNILSSLGGATEGIRGEIGKVGAAFVETNKDLFAAFETSFDRVGQLVPNLFGIFTTGVNDFTAYFTVKFQGIIDFVQGVFDGIGRIATSVWDLASLGFGKFSDLVTAGITQIQVFAAEQFAKVGEVFAGIGDQGKAAFDNVLLAVQPMADGLKAIFTGTVQDLDNFVQSGLDGFNGMVDQVATGFTAAFTNIKTAGADLSANLAAIPTQISSAFTNLVGSIGSTLASEFENAKASGSELLNALKGSFEDGTNQIGVMISGITTSFASVGDSITATIENLKATFSGLGEAIDGAMGNAFGGVKDKWQKTTGFMGKLMGKIAGDSEETGQLILHNMAENSPGPTQRIRELYALTATSVNNSLETIATAAKPIGAAIVDGLTPSGLQPMNNIVPFGPQPAPAAPASTAVAAEGKGVVGRRVANNTKSAADFGASLLELSGNAEAAKSFKAVSDSIGTVTTALDGVKAIKEIGDDFKLLKGVMGDFTSVTAAAQLEELGTSLMDSGKAVWDAITGFGQWIAAKLFQTSVGVTAEATMAGAAVAGGAATAGANTVVATTNAVAAESFVAVGVTAGTAWSLILAPIILIIAAIAALVAVIFLIKAAIDNNFLGIGDLFYKIGDAIGFVWNIVTGFFGALASGFMEIVGGVFGSLMTTVGEIGQIFTDLGTQLSAPFVELFAAISGVFAPILNMFPQVNGQLGGMAGVVNGILFPFKLIGESLKRVIWLIGMMIKAVVLIGGFVFKILLAPFMSVIKVVTAIANVFSILRDGVVAIGSAIWSAICSPFEFVTGLIKGIADQLGSLFSGPLGFLGGVFGFSPKVEPGAEVQQFSTGGFVSGAGGPTDDKIPAMLSNGEFVVGAAATANNRSFLEAINAGMPVQAALQLMDVPHPIGELPDRAAAGSAPTSAAASVTVENNYNISVSFGNIVLEGATGEEAAQDFSRFLQSTEFQMAVQAALASQVESMR